MDFRRLKELVRNLGGILVMDGDEPEFVILSYDNYAKINSEEVPLSTISRGPKGNGLAEARGNGMDGIMIGNYDDQEAVERLNQEIFSLKEEIRAKEEAELVERDSS